MKSGGFKTLVPRSLAARLIILLLLALVVSQAVSVVIFLDERQTAVRLGHQQQLLGRTAAVVRLLRDTPPEDRVDMLTFFFKYLKPDTGALSATPKSDSAPGGQNSKSETDSKDQSLK